MCEWGRLIHLPGAGKKGMEFSKRIDLLPAFYEKERPKTSLGFFQLRVYGCTALEQKSKTCKHFNLLSTAPNTGSHMKMESSWTHLHNYAYHNSAPEDIKLSTSNTSKKPTQITQPCPLTFPLISLQCLWAICIAFLNSWLDGIAYIGYIAYIIFLRLCQICPTLVESAP